MPFYVALLHLRPQALHTPRTSIQALENLVLARGGIIRAVNDAGRRPLAYPFKNKGGEGSFVQANVVTIEFLGKPREVNELGKAFRDSNEVLRATILRSDEVLARPADPAKLLEETRAKRRRERIDARTEMIGISKAKQSYTLNVIGGGQSRESYFANKLANGWIPPSSSSSSASFVSNRPPALRTRSFVPRQQQPPASSSTTTEEQTKAGETTTT